MCHQTVCLLARHFEAKGLPTLILGSALDILQAGAPPRAQFLDYPLGFEAGRFRDPSDQLIVVRQALSAFDTMNKPGIEYLPFTWEAGWTLVNERERQTESDDHRSPRNLEPQYQHESDRVLAEKLK